MTDERPPLSRRVLIGSGLALPVTFVAGAQAEPVRLAYDSEAGAQPSVRPVREVAEIVAPVADVGYEQALARWNAVKSDPRVSPQELTEALSDLQRAQSKREFALYRATRNE